MKMSLASQHLFACTRCNSRHPFEELSSGQQLCRECRNAYSTVKCTYCRSEFQQESKQGLNTICKKCEQNVKQFGKPSACEYCNLIAAFIGNKCQRCTNSEKKYGAPLTCEQCKQRSAFDRKDPESRKKVDGKLLCWLCTLSFKRALAKAKQNDTSIRHTSIIMPKSSSRSTSRPKSDRTHHHANSLNLNSSSTNNSTQLLTSNGNSSSNVSKKPRIELTKNSNGNLPSSSKPDSSILDPNNSEHVIMVTQLKDQINSLQKQVKLKDSELLDRDKKIADLKAQLSREDRVWREKFNNQNKMHQERITQAQQKLVELQRQNATLSKANKRVKDVTPNDSPLLS